MLAQINPDHIANESFRKIIHVANSFIRRRVPIEPVKKITIRRIRIVITKVLRIDFLRCYDGNVLDTTHTLQCLPQPLLL